MIIFNNKKVYIIIIISQIKCLALLILLLI